MQVDSAILISGVVFGLSAGLSPGPLLTLVMTETLRHGPAAGVRVALAPLVTDTPIILFTVLVVAQMSRVEPLMGAIALLGAGYLAYLGYDGVTFSGAPAPGGPDATRSLRKGVIANFLNPSPYLFWFTIGAPTILKALDVGPISAALFVALFYVCIVGAKVLLALALGRYRHFLGSRGYVLSIRVLGGVLFLFAALFLRDGVRYLGLWGH